MKKLPKVLVILGPTASGKSALAVEMALKFGGEIISADSRQVYKGLDIGTGKVTAEEMKGVPHHLLDISDASHRVSVVEWKEKAKKAMDEIISRGKLPIICGGTGFYIQSIVDNITLPEVTADEKMREELEKMSDGELMEELKKTDARRASEMDPKNRRRLIRALEIARALGHVPKIENSPSPDFDFLQIGLTLPDKILKEKIVKRLVQRIDGGMLEEIKNLHKNGLSYERMEELGLEYRYVSYFLKGKISSKDELVEILSAKIWQYARRQKTWWRKDARIKWFEPGEAEKIEGVIREFLGV
ncbi:MAG: tRNA (adenosine(37)-N6)-dimethylallyltransferase MiaA [Candidatus Taylorbacteria bacterium]|nr:tRNA (adenosine(37)-N6)-dimethylallyltransferase MiaA [Candidatus Taylorbacteria bacterium]